MKKASKKTTVVKKAVKTKKPVKRVETANRSKKPKQFVQYETIWKSVGGGLSNPGETKICRVGKHKVFAQREERLDRYGNPVYNVTVIKGNGTTGATVRSNGSLTQVVSQALKKEGVETKHKVKFPRK